MVIFQPIMFRGDVPPVSSKVVTTSVLSWASRAFETQSRPGNEPRGFHSETKQCFLIKPSYIYIYLLWICIHEYHNVPIQDFDLPKSRRLRRARGGLRCGFVTCAISLWCTNRSVPFGVRDFQHSCRAASLTDGLRAFGILGKRSALASGTGIFGFWCCYWVDCYPNHIGSGAAADAVSSRGFWSSSVANAE